MGAQSLKNLPFPDEYEIPDDSFRKIKTSDWMPKHDPLDYPKDFIEFVDSILAGWRNKKYYRPFDLYKKQAKQWLDEGDSILNYYNEDDQADYIVQEYFRCRDNSLYFANKYGKIKEGDADDGSGSVDFKAWEAQELIAFFFDCGYSCMIGKARQVGFTTLMGLIAQKSINFNNSYYAKFVTHSKPKGEEIFRDKIQWGFSKSIPDWLREKSHNFSGTVLSLEERSRKSATVGGASSRIEVVTPQVDAINGGSPQVTFVDEIGLFEGSMFSDMITEGRPTLFFFNTATGKMQMRRQLFAWGTGGEMKKGGAAFEIEFKAALKQWKERNFKHGIIPLFFDFWARNGMTEEMYQAEEKSYKAKGQESKFHQHLPRTIDDMFVRDAKTIIPVSECNKHLIRIYNLKGADQVQYGYFEPVLDISQPTPDGHLDYKLKGSTWVPTTGMDDNRTTAVIFRHPPNPADEIWKYRYYQGIDPINSETGHSKMSGSIWDAYENTISSVVFHRERDYKACFLQCVLQGLYYDPVDKMGVPELIENNIGTGYQDFEDMIGFGRRQVPNKALPPYMQTPNSSWWGISNKTNTAGKITNNIIEMIESYADNIYIPWLFLQLKTFVEKDLSSQSGRQTRYQAADMRYDYDDAIFSSVFAYINAKIHSRYDPEKLDETTEKKNEVRWVQTRDSNFKLVKALVNKKTGKVVRYLN